MEPLCEAAAPVEEACCGLAVWILGRGAVDVVGIDEAFTDGEELCRGVGASAGKGTGGRRLRRLCEQRLVVSPLVRARKSGQVEMERELSKITNSPETGIRLGHCQ